MVAAGRTDDDTTARICGPPQPTVPTFVMEDFEDLQYLILFHRLNIQSLLLVRDLKSSHVCSS